MTWIKVSDVLAGLAVVISIGSAWISYQSLKSTKQQVQLADLQIRPYIRYKPVFTEEHNDLLTTMISENLSAIPAKMIYSELKTWIDGKTTNAYLYNWTGDVLYEHHDGSSGLPPMPKDLAKLAINGKMEIMIGTCVVYGSVSPSDQRRWEVRALYSYQPHQELPRVEYFNERETADSVDRCDASNLRSQWQGIHDQPEPHSQATERQ